MLALLPLLPVLSALAAAALGRRPRLAASAAVAGLAATIAAGAWAAAATPASSWPWSPLLATRLAVEGFGRVMVVLVPAVALPIVAYAAATEAEGRTRLIALMTAFVGAMELLAAAGDLLTLLVAWELVGALSWALIAHHWREPERPRDAAIAFVTTRFGDLGLYAAAGIALAATGSLDYHAIAGAPRPALDLVAFGVLLAAAAKSAQVPFSPWLFAAMAGPTPVSALLHSATLVAAGAYVLIRLAPALEAVGWFLPAVTAVGLTTALAGGVVATMQSDAKRVLAASTSAHYGLMLVAIGAGAPAAGAAHLVAHAFFKSLLFLAAGSAIHLAGTRDLRRLALGRALPAVAALSAVGALALAGVPPLGAAWTKEQVLEAAVEASGWLAAGAFAAAFLSALYAARYQWLAFGPARAGAGAGPRSAGHVAPVEAGSLGLLALVTLLLSALWWPAAGRAALRVAGGEPAAGAAWETALTLALLGAAFALSWVLWKRGRLLTLGLPAGVLAGADWLGLPSLARTLVVRPTLALARTLRGLDDRVVDAGVRGVARVAALVSGGFSRRGEWTVDGAVWGVAAATVRLAAHSRAGDERGVDGAVEGAARGVGFAGGQSRRLQTGLSHHYYAWMAAGFVAIAVLLSVW